MKICHEFVHLLHPMISESIRKQRMKRVLGGEQKKKIGGVKFTDLGEMIEKKLFGGMYAE